jgi:hypothetical protein
METRNEREMEIRQKTRMETRENMVAWTMILELKVELRRVSKDPDDDGVVDGDMRMVSVVGIWGGGG